MKHCDYIINSGFFENIRCAYLISSVYSSICNAIIKYLYLILKI